MAQPPASYLLMEVGPYQVAIGSDVVETVRADIGAGDLEGFVDLRAAWLGEQRQRAPMAVTTSHRGVARTLGVDRVAYLRPSIAPEVVPLPSAGLLLPELFAGALRHPEGIALLLDPAALSALVSGE